MLFVLITGALAITPGDADLIWRSNSYNCKFILENIAKTNGCPGLACMEGNPLQIVLTSKAFSLKINAPAPFNGVFLSYISDNKCTYLDATEAHVNNHDVIVSGPFNGCTFAKCVAGGRLYVSHIFKGEYNKVTGEGTKKNMKGDDIPFKYVELAKSNPSDQARAFEKITGAADGSALGFKTKGLLLKYESSKIRPEGYVMGIYNNATGSWEWRWIVVDQNTARIMEYTDISDDRYWKPVTETE